MHLQRFAGRQNLLQATWQTGSVRPYAKPLSGNHGFSLRAISLQEHLSHLKNT